jgi:hypothetical protein
MMGPRAFVLANFPCTTMNFVILLSACLRCLNHAVVFPRVETHQPGTRGRFLVAEMFSDIHVGKLRFSVELIFIAIIFE